jgi:hypothetical protein
MLRAVCSRRMPDAPPLLSQPKPRALVSVSFPPDAATVVPQQQCGTLVCLRSAARSIVDAPSPATALESGGNYRLEPSVFTRGSCKAVGVPTGARSTPQFNTVGCLMRRAPRLSTERSPMRFYAHVRTRREYADTALSARFGQDRHCLDAMPSHSGMPFDPCHTLQPPTPGETPAGRSNVAPARSAASTTGAIFPLLCTACPCLTRGRHPLALIGCAGRCMHRAKSAPRGTSVAVASHRTQMDCVRPMHRNGCSTRGQSPLP